MLKLPDLKNYFNPQKILWVMVVLFSLGQLQRIEIFPNTAFYLHDLFIFAWVIYFFATNFSFAQEFIKLIVERIKKNNWLKIISAIILFSFINTLFYCFSYKTVIPILYIGRLICYLIFALSIYFYRIKSKLRNKYSWTQYLSVAFLIACLGILQIIFLPDIRFLYIFGWDDHYYRLISTLFDPAFTGLILLIGFLFSYKIINNKKLAFILRAILIVGIILTFSRTTYLAMVFSLLYYFSRNLSKQKLAGLSVGLLCITILIATVAGFLQISKGGEGTNLFRTSTIYARIENTKNNFSILSSKDLVLGKGWFINPITYTKIPDHSRVPDNLILLLINALGIPGAILLITSLFKLTKKTLLKNPEITSALIAIIIHAQFNNAFFQPFVWLYFWWGVASFLKKPTKASESR